MPQPFRALIVDDDPHLLDGLRRVLRPEPYDLITAANGAQALALLDAHRPEVVVTDYHMPGMLGTELLARARERLPDGARFLITGSPSLEVAVEAINQGAVTRIFIKPFQSMYLALAIREAMDRVELARLARRLVDQADEQQALIGRLRAEAAAAGRAAPAPAGSGSEPADDYQPHDIGEILRRLRQAVAARR
jgi:DNA-binding NtrC family response regulator